MEIIFRQKDNKHIEIYMNDIENKGNEKLVGHIFTPSGSGEINVNAIQICGFEAWGDEAPTEIQKELNSGEAIPPTSKDEGILARVL